MNKLLKYIIKGLIGLVVFLLIVFMSLKIIYSEDIPVGKADADADILAYKMLDALHFDRFLSAKQILWTFRDKNTYEWNLKNNIVDIYWDNYHVKYYTKNRENSIAFHEAKLLDGKAKEDAISSAISNFNNDSFWVVAPFKVFDKGTSRSIVKENGKEKLLVQFNTGGTTPGDAYLWELDSDYIPIGFKMWVSILPFEGLEAKWSNWEKTQGDFLLSTQKTIFGIEIPITNLKVIP